MGKRQTLIGLWSRSLSPPQRQRLHAEAGDLIRVCICIGPQSSISVRLRHNLDKRLDQIPEFLSAVRKLSIAFYFSLRADVARILFSANSTSPRHDVASTVNNVQAAFPLEIRCGR